MHRKFDAYEAIQRLKLVIIWLRPRNKSMSLYPTPDPQNTHTHTHTDSRVVMSPAVRHVPRARAASGTGFRQHVNCECGGSRQ